MGEVTLTVPGECVEFFRLGILSEIETDCGALIDNAQEMAASAPEATDDVDVQNTGRFIVSGLAILSQLQGASEANEVHLVEVGNSGVFEHALGATARDVIGPRLSDQLGYGPMNLDVAERIDPLMRALDWAVDMAARFARPSRDSGEES